MAINLQKGQRVDLGLSRAGIGLGWDPNEGTGAAYDLDASVFMIGADGKIPEDRFFVFYNNLESFDKAVVSSGDDTTGGNSEGDDETLTVDFAKLDPRINEMIVVVTIHEAAKRKQNFGQIRNSFIRIYDASSNEEICKYELEEDFSIETAVEFGRLYKKSGKWKFEAVGKGYAGGLQHFVDKYTG
ncbi:TerD family protein [Singulisphaera sp. PoT]|uniref:TerD family protein n=1 Tax=Singulisphaera sp. PoT TaxID=3411797 RepID=UPI003BF5AE77